jgi:hypothetical protein
MLFRRILYTCEIPSLMVWRALLLRQVNNNSSVNNNKERGRDEDATTPPHKEKRRARFDNCNKKDLVVPRVSSTILKSRILYSGFSIRLFRSD